MKTLLVGSLFIFNSFIICSCNKNDKIIKLEKEVDLLKKHIEQTHQVSFSDTTSIPNYRWFRLGYPGYSFVNSYFIVDSVISEYKNNGYEISGVVTNLLSLRMIQTKIFGAIINDSKNRKVITGYIEIPILNPGEKTEFSLFIPTSQTNVEKVGINITPGRM
jgi:hypothetical protein